MNLARNLEQSAFFFPDRPALSEDFVETSYSQFNDRANMVATALLQLGVEPGDHVGLCAPNSGDWVAFYFGILKAGGVAVTLSSLLKRDELERLINHSRPKPLIKQITTLFLSDRGLPLTKSGIQQMLRRYGRRAGLTTIQCCPHTFRHTFAKNYLLNGGDIFSLQKILGHTSLASVRVYLNLFATDIKKQHQRFSPVDNLAEDRSIYPIIR